jgi:hypothetical protein
MELAFKLWAKNRTLYLDFLEKYSLEQLNTIPAGFSNNLIWNIGHIVVIQQRLVYGCSGLPMNIPDELFTRYKPGSKPSTTETQETVDLLKGLLISLITQTKNDYAEGRFISYKEFTTLTGFHLASTEEAIAFNNYHEAMHLGFMMNIRKFI